MVFETVLWLFGVQSALNAARKKRTTTKEEEDLASLCQGLIAPADTDVCPSPANTKRTCCTVQRKGGKLIYFYELGDYE